MRLGLSVTACDLLPVGYVFLKAVLEYPQKHGSKLVNDVKLWGEWITQRLKDDPIIKGVLSSGITSSHPCLMMMLCIAAAEACYEEKD